MKVGCTNIAIALTLVGITPLVVGVAGLTKVITHLDEGFKISWLVMGVVFSIIGIAACGYRSCLYLHRGYGVFVRKMLGFVFREDKFNYSDFEKIYIETSWSLVSEGQGSTRHYNIGFVGGSKRLGVTDFVRFRNDVGHPHSFAKMQSLAHQMANISGLKVCCSDEVKELNDLTD